MITSRAEAKTIVEQYRQLFAPLLNVPCIIIFDIHTIQNIILKDIVLSTIGSKTNKPDKMLVDGKSKSPFIFDILTDEGILTFVLNDTTVVAITDGIRLMIGKTVIDIRKAL